MYYKIIIISYDYTWQIYPGKLNTNSLTYRFDIDEKFIYPIFKLHSHWRYDIALIKLTRDLPLIGSESGNYRMTLNGICLPQPLWRDDYNELALFAGYGYIEGKTLSNRLQIGWTIVYGFMNNSTDGYGKTLLAKRYP